MERPGDDPTPSIATWGSVDGKGLSGRPASLGRRSACPQRVITSSARCFGARSAAADMLKLCTFNISHFSEGALGARPRGHRLHGAPAAARTASAGNAPDRSPHSCAGSGARWSVRAGVECDHRLHRRQSRRYQADVDRSDRAGQGARVREGTRPGARSRRAARPVFGALEGIRWPAMPAELADLEASLRGRPTWDHVLRMYRDHRKPDHSGACAQQR